MKEYIPVLYLIGFCLFMFTIAWTFLPHGQDLHQMDQARKECHLKGGETELWLAFWKNSSIENGYKIEHWDYIHCIPLHD